MIELAPRDLRTHMGRGWALGQQGNHEGAEAAFHCALAIDPTNPHAQAGQYEAATHRGLEVEAREAVAQQAMTELLLEEQEEEQGGGGARTGGCGGGGGKKRSGGKKGKKKRK
jgi:hypothetical protein